MLTYSVVECEDGNLRKVTQNISVTKADEIFLHCDILD